MTREYAGKEQRRARFEGTPIYASLDTHEGFSQSRKDDMEMLAYSILVLKNNAKNPFFDDNEP